jgi:hypothetical protein
MNANAAVHHVPCRAAARRQLAGLPRDHDALTLAFYHTHLEAFYECFLNAKEARRDKLVGAGYTLLLLAAYRAGGFQAVLLSGGGAFQCAGAAMQVLLS